MGTEARRRAACEKGPAAPELYEGYCRFMREMGKERGREEFPLLDLKEFEEWFNGLDAVTREICASDFRKGYAAVVEEGKKQVAEVIAEYETADASGAQ
jgi:hypothetical protein